MRLLILTPEYDGSGGGIMTFYQSLTPALHAHGISVRVIEGSACHATRQKFARYVNGAQVETLEHDRLHRWYARFGHLAALPGLRRHIAASWAMWEQAGFGEDADIIEVCDWGLLFVAPAIDTTRPLVVQCHGSIGQIKQHDPILGEELEDVLTRLLEGAILAGVGTVQTYSCANATYWQKATGRNVLMCRSAIRMATSTAQPVSDRGLVVGRVQRWKGPQVLCIALEHVAHRTVLIDWIGRDTPWQYRDGSTVSYLRTKYSSVWGQRIVHHAPIPSENVQQRQASAFFNLVPSTWDVFNFTAVEAMASGRPTIVSTGAGASELIEDGVNGYIFPADDASALASKIDEVLAENPVRLANIGCAAQATVRRTLDPLTIAAQHIAAYQSTIEGFNRHWRPMNFEWLDEICRPGNQRVKDHARFLDQLPLRVLMRHVGERLEKKIALSRGQRSIV